MASKQPSAMPLRYGKLGSNDRRSKKEITIYNVLNILLKHGTMKRTYYFYIDLSIKILIYMIVGYFSNWNRNVKTICTVSLYTNLIKYSDKIDILFSSFSILTKDR